MPFSSKSAARTYYLANGKRMREQMRALYDKRTYGHSVTVPEYNDILKDENILKYWDARERQTNETLATCSHNYIETPSLDKNGIEIVCDKCGEAPEIEVEEPVKLSGCMDLESFLNVCYGPPTPIFLENFLVPTLRRIKCRDRYVDIKILSKLRTYTAILRVCDQYGIPKVYANDAMRMLLKRKKGLYSKYAFIRVLIEIIASDPRLSKRIPDLEKLLVRS